MNQDICNIKKIEHTRQKKSTLQVVCMYMYVNVSFHFISLFVCCCKTFVNIKIVIYFLHKFYINGIVVFAIHVSFIDAMCYRSPHFNTFRFYYIRLISAKLVHHTHTPQSCFGVLCGPTWLKLSDSNSSSNSRECYYQ